WFNGYLKMKRVSEIGSAFFYRKILIKKLRKKLRNFKLLNKLNSYKKTKFENEDATKIFAYSLIFACVMIISNSVIKNIKHNIKLFLNSINMRDFYKY